MATTKLAGGMRVFTLIWLGQVISLTGSELTSFALAVWVYQRTGEVTQYALISLFTLLPSIVLAPIAGALIDRWDRRWAMILSDLASGLSTVVIAVLLFMGQLEIWHIYLATGASSILRAFQVPAYATLPALLAPKEQQGRASGMIQIGQAVAQIAAPAVAGVLVLLIGISGVIFIDFVSFLFALATLLVARVPRPPATSDGARGRGSLLRESAYGWHYIVQRPGLLGLLAFFGLTNFVTSLVQVLITPLVLSFASPTVLGSVLSFAGTGMLLGSIAMGVWGGPKRRIHGVLGFSILQGIALLIGGVQQNAAAIAVAAFVFLFGLPIVRGSSQVIWQIKVAPDVQGRVFAVRHMLALSPIPLAFLVAGPLADRVFEPLLATGGSLSGSLGQLYGVGPGRGLGLLFSMLGVVTIIMVIVGYLYPRVRLVEDELPDTIISEESVVGETLATA